MYWGDGETHNVVACLRATDVGRGLLEGRLQTGPVNVLPLAPAGCPGFPPRLLFFDFAPAVEPLSNAPNGLIDLGPVLS